jgi:hypothetical protein
MLILAAALALHTIDDWDGLRSRIAGVGDVDCDGTPDLVVASRGLVPEVVWVLSGRDGAQLLAIESDAPGLRFGCSLASAGDVDGDGRADVVVGAARTGPVPAGADPGHASVYSGFIGESDGIADPSPGFAHVYSGRTGARLCAYRPGGKRLDACGAGDVDRDGAPDLAVFVSADELVRVVSGRDLSTVWEVALR